VENLSQKNKNVNKLPKVKFERKKMIWIFLACQQFDV
jgi:hypothetical protein